MSSRSSSSQCNKKLVEMFKDELNCRSTLELVGLWRQNGTRSEEKEEKNTKCVSKAVISKRWTLWPPRVRSRFHYAANFIKMLLIFLSMLIILLNNCAWKSERMYMHYIAIVDLNPDCARRRGIHQILIEIFSRRMLDREGWNLITVLTLNACLLFRTYASKVWSFFWQNHVESINKCFKKFLIIFLILIMKILKLLL